jgi:hypothetical protein
MKQYVNETKLLTERGAIESTTVETRQLVHSERIRIIVDELVAGKSKRAIITEYSTKWNLPPKTLTFMLNEAIVHLHTEHSGITVDELRSEQVSKLEELYENATTAEKLKIIDLVSSTLGLYDTNLNVKTSEEIKINLGV